MPTSRQSTFVLASLAHHDYDGVALRDDEKPRPQADLGHKTFLVLRNHGLLTVGGTMADACLSMVTCENTCRIQLDALAGGNTLKPVEAQILQDLARAMQTVTAGQAAALVSPAVLRKLDRMDPGCKD